MVEAASIYFVDVGQGSSTVIAFDDDSIVIIDCGPTAGPLIDLLENLRFKRIATVVLSHWHQDHVGGATKLVEKYADRIDGVHFARDRPTHDLLKNAVLTELRELSENESKFWLQQLCIQGNLSGHLYPVESGHACQAKVLYPTQCESMEEEHRPDSNQGSGIISITAGKARILIPGDAGRRAFETLLSRRENERIECDIVCAPHHSGNLSQGAQTYQGFGNAFEWFYRTVVDAKHVIVSAGTGNKHGHPKPDHVMAVRRAGASVQCTELTLACAKQTLIKSLNQGSCSVDPMPAHRGLHWAASSTAVGCAGTIRVDLTKDAASIHRLTEHQTAIDQKLDASLALCRCSL